MEVYEHIDKGFLNASRFRRRREYAIRLRHAFRRLGGPDDRAELASIAGSAASIAGQTRESLRLYRLASMLRSRQCEGAFTLAVAYYGEATDSQLPPARRFAMMHAARKEAGRTLRLRAAEGRSTKRYEEALSCILKMPMGRLPKPNRRRRF